MMKLSASGYFAINIHLRSRTDAHTFKCNSNVSLQETALVQHGVKQSMNSEELTQMF